MSLYRRGKVWHYDFMRGKKRYWGTTGQTTYRAAHDYERNVRNAIDEGRFAALQSRKTTFSDYVPRVMANVRLRHPDKPRTIDFYANNYARICDDKKFASLPLHEIGEADINDYAVRCKESVGKRTGTEVMAATVNRRLACIKKALRLAKREGYIVSVPYIELLAGERQREHVIMGRERDTFLNGGEWEKEWERDGKEWVKLTKPVPVILAPLPDPLHSFYEFLFETGLRLTEAVTLTWGNVYEDPGLGAYVKLVRTKTKSKKERNVPLTDRALEIVRDQRRVSKSDYVFVRFGKTTRAVDCFHKPLNRSVVSKYFSRRRDEMGLPWDACLHSTRHSALTELGASGASAFVIQKIAGHASITVSQKYVHPMESELMEAFKRKTAYGEVRLERDLEKTEGKRTEVVQ